MIKNKYMSENQITQEEAQANHDAWWDSLTNKDKERLYNEMVQSEVTYYEGKLTENKS
jgi:hypothetical protein|tara:strand:+ start:575 stop:748 length:174 start_codon:yes stop_codon:yes gene_type:complete